MLNERDLKVKSIQDLQLAEGIKQQLERELAENDHTIDKLKDELRSFRVELDNAKKSLEVEKQKAKKLEEQSAKLKQLSSLEEELQKLKSEHEQISQENSDFIDHAIELEEQLKAKTLEIEALQHQLEENTSKAETAETEKLEVAILDLHKQVEVLTISLEEEKQRNNDFQKVKIYFPT